MNFNFGNKKGLENFVISDTLNNADKFVKILNKGGYVAALKLTYELQNQLITQTGSIAVGKMK